MRKLVGLVAVLLMFGALVLAVGCGGGDSAAPAESGERSDGAGGEFAPPPGEPDLSAMTLRLGDLPEGFEVREQGYVDPRGASVARYLWAAVARDGTVVVGGSEIGLAAGRVILFASEVEAAGRIGSLVATCESAETLEPYLEHRTGVDCTDVEAVDVAGVGDRAVGGRATVEDAKYGEQFVMIFVQVGRTVHEVWANGPVVDSGDVMQLARIQAERARAVLEAAPVLDEEAGSAEVEALAEMALTAGELREFASDLGADSVEASLFVSAEDHAASTSDPGDTAQDVLDSGWLGRYELGVRDPAATAADTRGVATAIIILELFADSASASMELASDTAEVEEQEGTELSGGRLLENVERFPVDGLGDWAVGSVYTYLVLDSLRLYETEIVFRVDSVLAEIDFTHSDDVDRRSEVEAAARALEQRINTVLGRETAEP